MSSTHALQYLRNYEIIENNLYFRFHWAIMGGLNI